LRFAKGIIRSGAIRNAGSCGAWLLALNCLLAETGCSNTTLDFEFEPDVGLLAHWALDEEQSGQTVADSSGFGNNGTPSANPPVPSPEVPPVHFRDPHSMSFNGKDQWIEMGNPPLLNLGGVISMAAWVRIHAIDTIDHNIVAHGYTWSSAHDLALRIHASTFMFTMWNSSDHAAVANISPSDVGQWVHLCGVFDGTAYHLYRNGELVASNPDSAPPAANIEDAIWAIGARATSATSGGSLDYQLQGEIDDVRIYGRGLTADDVRELYQR
jgi:hypothetical protein